MMMISVPSTPYFGDCLPGPVPQGSTHLSMVTMSWAESCEGFPRITFSNCCSNVSYRADINLSFHILTAIFQKDLG